MRPFQQSLIQRVDAEKRERIHRLVREADRERSLLGEILSRHVLGKRLGVLDDTLSFGRGPFGKPYLLGAFRLHFNVSHSGNWVICGLGSTEVGVDVELIGEANLEIAERFFAPREFKILKDTPVSDRPRVFHDLWTLKESYVKARGGGLLLPLNEFEMVFMQDSIRAISASGDSGYYFRTYPEVDAGYAFASCGGSPMPEKPVVWDCGTLLREYLERIADGGENGLS